jgi:hypothetical protein
MTFEYQSVVLHDPERDCQIFCVWGRLTIML